ncbi:MAG: TonB-dependent receptor [Gemmatimonadaceae bacterium]
MSAHTLAPVSVAGTRLSARADRRTAARVDVVNVGTSLSGLARAADALSTLPGVSLTNDQGNRAQPTVEFRGFTLSPVAGVPQGVSVFLDGVRVNEPDAQEVNFDLLPTDAIDHAELLRGPSAVFGKNTLGGALSLSTVRGSAIPHVTLTAESGSFGYNGIHLLARGERNGIDGVVSGVASRGGGYQVKSGSTTRQLFSTVGRKTDRSDLALSLLYAKDELYEAGSLPESWLEYDRRANYSAGDFFRPDLLQVVLRGSNALRNSVLRGNVFTRRNASEQFNVNAQDPDTRAFVRNQSVGGTAELDAPAMLAGLPIGLSLGAEYTHSAVAYRVFGEPNVAAPDGSPDCDAQSRLCEDARVNGDDAALFAQAIVQMTSQLSLLAAVREDEVRVPFRDLRDSENNGTNTFRHLSPKLGLTYLNANHLRVYASAGNGFRAPAALELACASPSAPCPLPFSLGADPPLSPVVAWSSEVGSDWEPGRATALRLSLFQERVRDEIVFVSSQTAAGYFKNIGRTLRQGLEASGNFEPAKGVTLFASYAFLDATYQSAAVLSSALDNDSVRAGDQLALTPRHVGNAGVRSTNAFRSLVLDATLAAHLVSSQFLRGDEANRTEPLPGYAVARLQVALEHAHARLAATVDNLFNRRYEVFGVYATNVKGVPGSPPLAAPTVERFLSPALPRSITVSVALMP